MKRIILIFIGIVASLIINAQNSDYFNYQAIIRDASGNIKGNSNVTIAIEIVQGSTSGSVVYSETHTATTNVFGLVTLEIGSKNSTSFSTINWANAPYFIRVSVDGTEMGTSQLLSVPYALHAKRAETYSETDPIFLAHPANGITSTNLSNWNTAYGWGNHATAGYLTNFTEADPIFVASAANGITSTNLLNWNSAYSWGNHALAGYLTSFTETDPVFLAHPAYGINSGNISNWNTAFGWGDHSGKYKLISYIPDWSELTNNPLSISSPTNNQLLKYNSGSSKWENWTPDFLTSEVDGSVTNELQTLSLNTNQLTISSAGGNTVTFTNWDTDKTDDVTLVAPTSGDMLYYNGTNWAAIHKGIQGQVLIMNSSGFPEWQSNFAPPTATTQPATFNLPNVVLNGVINPNRMPTDVTFEYGTTTSYGTTVAADQSPVNGVLDLSVSHSISGLVAGTTYHYRIKAVNCIGTSYGNDMTFTYLGLGTTWAGGIIFYLDVSGQHGLVAAAADQTTSSWGCYLTSISGADGTVVGTGSQNTTDIINGCATAGIAAKICRTYAGGGYNDWFLPSQDELGLMYTNLKLNSLGGFSAVNYWCSSESSSTQAVWQSFNTGSTGLGNKTVSYNVRAARAF